MQVVVDVVDDDHGFSSEVGLHELECEPPPLERLVGVEVEEINRSARVQDGRQVRSVTIEQQRPSVVERGVHDHPDERAIVVVQPWAVVDQL